MIISVLIAVIAGIAAGFGGATVVSKQKLGVAAGEAEKERQAAKKEADELVSDAKREAQKVSDQAKQAEEERRREMKETERRLAKREETLDNKLDTLDYRSEKLRSSEDELDSLKDEVRGIRSSAQEKLEKIAKLSKTEAAEKLMKMTARDIKKDLEGLVAKLQHDATEDAQERAQMVITQAMERMASEVTTEKTVTAVRLTDDDMKGRII